MWWQLGEREPGKSTCNLILNRHVARVGFLAIHDFHDVSDRQRIPFVVKLKRTAAAFETDLRQRIVNRRQYPSQP
jgi:hypothetical protein